MVAVLIVLLAAALGALGGWQLRQVQQPLPPLAVPSGAPTPAAIAAATQAPAAPATEPSAAPQSATVVAARLAGPLADPRLGGRTLASVVDLATGTVLFHHGGGQPAPPASTAKLTTTAALLTVRPSTYRITTTVTAGPTPDSVVLVGAGDPTLSAAPPGTPTLYAGAARIVDLAAKVMAARAGRPVTTVYVDDSLFPGPATGPGWDPTDVPTDYASPITAAMVDGGRDSPNAVIRSANPALAAGQALARALNAPNAQLATAPLPGAPVLGSVQSAPILEIVDEMLQQSDNVLAECLARQVALARGQPASFAGAVVAVRQVLPEIGTGMVDGSGLSRDDRLTPAALTTVLQLITNTDRLRGAIELLPVGGWDGTLAGRFLGPQATAAAGLVRAKTGTLTGVSTLAGTVLTHDGRLLGFALLADQVGPTYGDTLRAESALDQVAAVLASCGCR